jgi:hypothetical protein
MSLSLSTISTAALLLAAWPAAAQEAAAPPDTAPTPEFTVNSGTKVPLSLINSISTKHSLAGDTVYLETAFPVVVNGRIVIPVGSNVQGTVTQIKKPGRVKGRGELYIRFDSLILPNGVTRDFRARMTGMDASATGNVDRAEGKVQSEGNKSGDARTVGETAASGASLGGIVGSVAGHTGMGIGVGAAAGAAAGLIGVLATRGPDAVLPRGTTVEMVIDRPVIFNEGELDFGNYAPPRGISTPYPPANPKNAKGGILPRHPGQ